MLLFLLILVVLALVICVDGGCLAVVVAAVAFLVARAAGLL